MVENYNLLMVKSTYGHTVLLKIVYWTNKIQEYVENFNLQVEWWEVQRGWAGGVSFQTKLSWLGRSATEAGSIA